MKKTAELLINSRSRAGSPLVLKQIVHEFSKHNVKITVVHRVSKKQPLALVIDGIMKNKPGLLVVASGDGTVSSIIDRLVGTDIELGIVPLGTTNNLARSLNIPLNVPEAVGFVISEKARAIDLGSINGEYFTNVAGIGLSARIASGVTHTQKQRWGRLAYGITAVKSLWSQKPFRITIEDPDRELSITLETRQFIVANGRFHAGKEIAQDNSIANGKLVLFALGGASRMSLIWHTLDFYFGSREKIAHASYFVGRDVRLRTSSPQSIELDGEVRMLTPVKVRVETAAVKVRY
ncbi:MAG: YegS/Rv2252/BmrU family lipid kinase [Candidatus Saccharimonadales bacterium]